MVDCDTFLTTLHAMIFANPKAWMRNTPQVQPRRCPVAR